MASREPRSTSQHGVSGRVHSHSLSLGSVNPSYRVTRRKSMSTNTASNAAAMAAVLKEAGEPPLPASLPNHRRSFMGRGVHTGMVKNDTVAEQWETRPTQSEDPNVVSAVEDGPPLREAIDARVSKLPRARRASEGSALSRSEGKRMTGNNELRCEKCGKGYKHSSCLSKHLWEHTPEWSYTSKLLISKHQQVQLLEAASVLVSMNQDGPEDMPDSGKAFTTSSSSSPSPSVSGSGDSGAQDGVSSTQTTPPPHAEESSGTPPPPHSTSTSFRATRTRSRRRSYRNSFSFSGSGSFPRSSSITAAGSSAPTRSPGFTGYHHRPPSTSSRPVSSGPALVGETDEETRSLTAAVELLSCGFGAQGAPGTPLSGGHIPGDDVPPVPPLPARFLDGAQQAGRPSIPVSNQRTRTEETDVAMADSPGYESARGEAEEASPPYHSESEEEEFFGTMEQ